jgi:thioredoxin-dependent peroxiredoxin
MAEHTLSKGDKAPDFSGLDQHGNRISLADFAGKKLILFFYPKDNTPGCTAEACNLRDHYQELTDKGFALLGVSPDSAASHQKFISKFNLPFPLIADTDQTILKAYGAWGEKSMYGKVYEGVLRSTFVISESGHILLPITKVNTKDHTAQILSELDSL